MQTQGGADAEKVITASERRFRIRVQVDWDKDGNYTHELSDLGKYCSKISVNRALEGSAPSEIMLIEGSSAAELEFTFGGEYQGLPFTAVFSPYNGNSPLYLKEMVGCEVKYWIGVEAGALGTIWYQQFVGNIRTVSPNRGDGKVHITALDRAEKLRQLIQFAPWAVTEWSTLGQSLRNQWLSGTWVIDNCLRHCDTSPTPYRPEYRSEMSVPEDSLDGTFFYLTGNGGWTPAIGFVDNVSALQFQPDVSPTPMYKVGGPEHPLTTPTDTPPRAFQANLTDGETRARYWLSDRIKTQMPGTHYLGMTLLTDDSTDTSRWMTAARTEIFVVWVGEWIKIVVVVGDTGKIWTEIIDYDTATTRASAKLTIPTTGDYQRVSVMWDLSEPTGTRAYLRCGNVDFGGWQSLSSLPDTNSDVDPLRGLVEVQRYVSGQDYIYKYRNIYGATVTNEVAGTASYAAVLDQSKNHASYIPNRSADAWDIVKAVAGSEMGSVFWDENGVFRFWTFERLLGLQSNPVRTLTLNHVSGLSIEWSLDSVRNIWTTTTRKKRAIISDRLYESRDANEFIVPPFEIKQFRIWVENGYSVNPFALDRYKSSSGAPGSGVPVWDDATTTSGFVPQWWTGSAWAEMDRGLGTDPYAWFAENGDFYLQVYNGWPEPMRFAQDDNNPRLRLLGTAIIDHGAELSTSIKDMDSVALFGPRNLPLSGDFYQEEIFIHHAAPDLLARTSRPIPTTEAIEIPGDPRLQLGDALDIVDPLGLGENIKVQIYGITRTWDIDQGLTDNLTVEVLRTPGIGLWDSPQYGRWNETFIWS